jgi:hypothetical protein
MHWKVIVSHAGAEAAGMPDPSDWADLLSPETDLSSAVPPEDGRCPRCHRHAVECLWQIFADEPATAPDRVTGPIFVMCLCRNLYRYAGVHAVRADQPIGEATVRAASVTLTPGTGALQIDGQPVPPLVIEEIAVTEEVAHYDEPREPRLVSQSATTPWESSGRSSD